MSELEESKNENTEDHHVRVTERMSSISDNSTGQLDEVMKQKSQQVESSKKKFEGTQIRQNPNAVIQVQNFINLSQNNLGSLLQNSNMSIEQNRSKQEESK